MALRDSLEDVLPQLHQDLQLLMASLHRGVVQFYGVDVGDASVGDFASDFEMAVTRWSANLVSLIGDGAAAHELVGPVGAMTQAVRDLEDQLTMLHYRKGVLDGMCAAEDAREVEYPDAEIPF